MRAFFVSNMGWEVIKDPSVKIVADTFTEAQLEAVISFLKSTYGKAFAEKSPAVTTKISEVVAGNLNKAIAAMQKPK